MANSILREKSKDFAKSIVLLCREMKQQKIEYALVDQLLRSGTSVGANIHEARYAQGTKDFISKFEIALKECNETEGWLQLLFNTHIIDEETHKKHRNLCGRIRRMLIASCKTLKEKL